MVLRKLSQNFRIFMALLLAVLSSGLLQAAPAYANNGTLQPVWCQITGNHWSANPGQGSNDQRSPLTGSYQDGSGTVTAENIGKYPTAVVGQTLWSNASEKPKNLDDECEKQYGKTVTPTAPTVKDDPCGTANDRYIIPAKQGVLYRVGNVTKDAGDNPTNGALSVTITAIPVDGFTLTGDVSWTLSFTNESCQPTTTPTPLPSGIADICGINNDTVPETNTATYTIAHDTKWVNRSRTITYATVGNLVFTPASGWIVSDDGKTATYTYQDWGTPCSPKPADKVEPGEWVIGDWKCGDTAATMTRTVTTTPYIAANCGWVLGTANAKITTETQTHTLTKEEIAAKCGCQSNCGCESQCAPIPAVELTCTLTGVDIVVRNTNLHMPVTVQINGVETTIQAGASSTVHAPFTDLQSRTAPTKVTDISGKIKYGAETKSCPVTPENPGEGGGGGGGQVEGDKDVCPNIPGSQTVVPNGMTKDADGNCSTPGGHVSPAAVSTSLPATIPATGGISEGNPFLIIIASLVAYGSVYFLQGRRKLASSNL